MQPFPRPQYFGCFEPGALCSLPPMGEEYLVLPRIPQVPGAIPQQLASCLDPEHNRLGAQHRRTDLLYAPW